MLPVLPDRTDSMDDKPHRQVVAVRNLFLPAPAPVQVPAFSDQARPCSPVDRAIDPTPAKQRRVCGIHNSIDMLQCDVAHEYGYPLTALVGHFKKKDSCPMIK